MTEKEKLEIKKLLEPLETKIDDSRIEQGEMNKALIGTLEKPGQLTKIWSSIKLLKWNAVLHWTCLGGIGLGLWTLFKQFLAK